MKWWFEDNCQWYRFLQGGRWAKWEGMWAQEQHFGWGFSKCHFKRGRLWIGVWEMNVLLDYNSPHVTDREDYE